MNIYEKLSYSLKWISLESLIYHFLFLGHQVLLIKTCGYEAYGAIGALFSIVYLTVTITSIGLESSLSPFFKEITRCKKKFRLFFVQQLIPTLLLSIATLPVFIFCKKIVSQEISSFFILIISLIILLESIKKTLRAILYLTFNPKINMYVETISFSLYVATIWLLYALRGSISLHTIFIPMFFMSAISCIILFLYVYTFYAQLPSGSTCKKSNIAFTRILKCRAINFINQLSHNMFSSNFLVPFFAMQFGLAQAGVFKILSHISYTITTLMRKIFGWTSDALLSQAKDLSIKEKRHIFSHISQKINHVLIGIILFFSINISKILHLTNRSKTILNWQLISFFMVITLIENLFISYEKFYIAEEKNGLLLFINLLSIALLVPVIQYASHLSQLLLLFYIATIRATTFLLLAFISFYQWKIRPNVKLKPLYIAGILLASFLFFIVL